MIGLRSASGHEYRTRQVTVKTFLDLSILDQTHTEQRQVITTVHLVATVEHTVDSKSD